LPPASHGHHNAIVYVAIILLVPMIAPPAAEIEIRYSTTDLVVMIMVTGSWRLLLVRTL
jgi:hypothetical protein